MAGLHLIAVGFDAEFEALFRAAFRKQGWTMYTLPSTANLIEEVVAVGARFVLVANPPFDADDVRELLAGDERTKEVEVLEIDVKGDGGSAAAVHTIFDWSPPGDEELWSRRTF